MFSAGKAMVAGWSRGAALKCGGGSGRRSLSGASTNLEGLKKSWEKASAYYSKQEQMMVYYFGEVFTLEKTPITFWGLVTAGAYLAIHVHHSHSNTGVGEYLALKRKHAGATPQECFKEIENSLVSLDDKIDKFEEFMDTKLEELSRDAKLRRARLDRLSRG